MNKIAKSFSGHSKTNARTKIAWAIPSHQKAAKKAPVKGGIEFPYELLSEFGLTVSETDIDTNMDTEEERRYYQRMDSSVFLDPDIAIYTNNLTKSIPSQDMLLDISASGLLLVSDRKMEMGDILLLEFRMVTDKFKLKGQVIRSKDKTRGIKFINPPPEIVDSIERIYGSVRLNKSRRGQKRYGR